MRTKLLVLGAALLVGGAACALVADLGDRTLGDPNSNDGRFDATIDPSNDGGTDPVPVEAGALTGFTYRRTISLTADTASPLTSHVVLVVLPSSFDYEHTVAGGGDIRFSTGSKHEDDLEYFIEKWTPAGESLVWVKLTDVPIGSSAIYMFYGGVSAPRSSFERTFPRAQRTAGGDAGSFTATTDIDVDWFELRAGDTLRLSSGAPLTISAQRLIVAGDIQGTGFGAAGGLQDAGGGGLGGGTSAGASEGAGGGGYGGAGGHGGEDTAGGGGRGGVAYGDAANDEIALGSGGAGTDDARGGPGGGALSLHGWRTTVSGTIRMNGVSGGQGDGRSAGGGSGGGILVAGCFLDLAGSTLSANGAAGGPCRIANNDGGGGGGGGRIKLRRRPTGFFIPPSAMTVDFGLGGDGAGSTAPGSPGLVGTTNVNEASTLRKGVETVLGAAGDAP